MRLKFKLVLACLEIVLVLTQDRCTVCAERTIGLENRFGRTRWNSEVTRVMSNHVLVRLEMVLESVQDRCMVRAKRTIGSENRFGCTDGTPR